jgi:hypothetical protein
MKHSMAGYADYAAGLSKLTLGVRSVFADYRYTHPKCFEIGDLHHNRSSGDCKLLFLRRPRRSKASGLTKTLVTTSFHPCQITLR